MKFLCDQCKAKYQIADEKVQGKTLRMKCRKCGHVIEIRATGETASSGDTMQVDSLSEQAAADAIARAKAQPVRSPSTTPPAKPAPVAKTSPPRPASVAAPKPVVVAPKPAAAPRPGAPRPAEKEGGALSSAFSKGLTSQKKPDAQPASPQHHDTPPEEWYAAIDDVPVGPIRLTELRQKYAQGSLTDDSLVWREGFEEWRPLRTLTDLYQLVREEVSGAFHPPGTRNSLLPSAPGQQQKRGTAAPAAGRSSARPQTTPTPAPVAARGNVIPFSPSARGAAAARKLDEEQFDEEATQIANPAVIVPQPTAAAAAHVSDDPFAARKASVAPIPAPTPPTSSAAPAAPFSIDEPQRLTMLDRLSNRAGISKGSTALIAAGALLLGVLIAVLLVKPRIVERVVEKRVEVPVSVEVPVMVQGGPAVSASAEPSAPKVAWKGGPAAPKATVAPTANSGGGSLTPKFDPSLGGPAPPTDPGGPPVPGGPAAGALEGKSVENVVSSKRVGVRKQCYESGAADKGDASVKLQLKINGSGGVDSADIISSDGPAASLVGPCIQRMAKNWRFPASESGGTFNIPFIFKT